MSSTIKIPCPVGQVSDGYHTFDELYDHRCLLFIALMKAHPTDSWFSMAHDGGGALTGWFIAGMTLPTGKVISYHLPKKYWEFAKSTHAEERERAPKWDGHTSDDVIGRLLDWL